MLRKRNLARWPLSQQSLLIPPRGSASGISTAHLIGLVSLRNPLRTMLVEVGRRAAVSSTSSTRDAGISPPLGAVANCETH